MRNNCILHLATNTIISLLCKHSLLSPKIVGQASLYVIGFVAVLQCLTSSFTYEKQRQMQHVQISVKWKEIDGFPGFFVSNKGHVKFHKTILTPKKKLSGSDYPYVVLRHKWKLWPEYIHKLVWMNFSGKKKIKGWHIHHIDGNVNNNCIENLAYLSPKEHFDIHDATRLRDSKGSFLPKNSASQV